MQIDYKRQGDKLICALSGRLDRTTVSELERLLSGTLDGKTGLILDFERVEYLSSAGLRVLLAAQRKMPVGGRVVIRKANAFVRHVLDATGMTDIFQVEE